MEFLKKFIKVSCYATVIAIMLLAVLCWNTVMLHFGVSMFTVTISGWLLCVAIMIMAYWSRAVIRWIKDTYRKRKTVKEIAAKIGVHVLDIPKPVVDTDPKSEWAYG